jgi:alanine-synthesizing transaminase
MDGSGGNKECAGDYLVEGLKCSICGFAVMLRAQYAIQTALGDFQHLEALISPGGRLYEQHNTAYACFNPSPVFPSNPSICFLR